MTGFSLKYVLEYVKYKLHSHSLCLLIEPMLIFLNINPVLEPGDTGISFGSLQPGKLKGILQRETRVSLASSEIGIGSLSPMRWPRGVRVSILILHMASFLKSTPDQVPKVQVPCQVVCPISCFPIIPSLLYETPPPHTHSSPVTMGTPYSNA